MLSNKMEGISSMRVNWWDSILIAYESLRSPLSYINQELGLETLIITDRNY